MRGEHSDEARHTLQVGRVRSSCSLGGGRVRYPWRPWICGRFLVMRLQHATVKAWTGKCRLGNEYAICTVCSAPFLP